MSLSKLLGVSARLFKGRKATYSCIFLSVILGLTAGCQFKTKSEAIQDYKAKGKTAKIIPYIHDPQQAIRLEAIEALVDLRASDAGVQDEAFRHDGYQPACRNGSSA